MKRIVAILALLLSLIGTAVSQAQQPVKPPITDVRPVEVQVRKLWEAFKKKDKATLSSLLDDQFRMFEEGLTTFGDKKAEVNGPDEYELLNYTLSDFDVKAIGPNTALVTYLAQYEGKSGGEMLKGKSIFGEVWVHTRGDWKALYLQETYVK
jgi:hypothetical protein